MFQWNAHMLNLHVNSHTEHRQINKDTPFIPLKVLFYHKHTEVKVTQSCPTLCNPMDYTVHGILQARILEWVVFSFLQGLFPTQGLNPGLLHCRWSLYQLSPKRLGTTVLMATTLKTIPPAQIAP